MRIRDSEPQRGRVTTRRTSEGRGSPCGTEFVRENPAWACTRSPGRPWNPYRFGYCHAAQASLSRNYTLLAAQDLKPANTPGYRMYCAIRSEEHTFELQSLT